jgi:histidinol-phosphate aminotransferase
VWQCEPSSPLGQSLDAIPVLPADAIAVLDCAYAPLRLGGTPRLFDAWRDRAWQLWTPNKALGLTGVRAAYAIAPAGRDGALADLLARLAPSWPVGAHGLALLQSWTTDVVQQWMAQSLETLREWKRMQRALCESLGWDALPSDASFFCADTRMADAAPLVQALRAHDVQLRDAASFGLPGHVRLNVMPRASRQALREAVARWQRERP